MQVPPRTTQWSTQPLHTDVELCLKGGEGCRRRNITIINGHNKVPVHNCIVLCLPRLCVPAWFVTMAVSSPRYLTACWAKLNACKADSGGSLHFSPSVHGASHNFTPASGFGGRVVSSRSCTHTRCKGVGIGCKGTLRSHQKTC